MYCGGDIGFGWFDLFVLYLYEGHVDGLFKFVLAPLGSFTLNL